MTNYEKICAYINAWHYAIAEYDGGEIKFTDIPEQGKLCYNHGRCDEGRVSGLSLTRIYPLPRPIPKYKIGDKVVVLENIKEFAIWDKFTAGEICKVTGATPLSGGVWIENQSGLNWYVLPNCVAPYFEDEVEEMTVEQICKALGKNIKIVK